MAALFASWWGCQLGQNIWNRMNCIGIGQCHAVFDYYESGNMKEIFYVNCESINVMKYYCATSHVKHKQNKAELSSRKCQESINHSGSIINAWWLSNCITDLIWLFPSKTKPKRKQKPKRKPNQLPKYLHFPLSCLNSFISNWNLANIVEIFLFSNRK